MDPRDDWLQDNSECRCHHQPLKPLERRRRREHQRFVELISLKQELIINKFLGVWRIPWWELQIISPLKYYNE